MNLTKKYKVLVKTGLTTEDGVLHPQGDIVELDPENQVTKDHLNSLGVIEEVVIAHDPISEAGAAANATAEIPPAPTPELTPEQVADAVRVPQLFYKDKLVVREDARLVGEKTLHVLHLSTGETVEATDEEYSRDVKVVD